MEEAVERAVRIKASGSIVKLFMLFSAQRCGCVCISLGGVHFHFVAMVVFSFKRSFDPRGS